MSGVAIGMPVFNGAHYLGAAIESILSQTYTDFELVISDNASTDATEEICQGYARQDPRIRYIRQPVNIGAARNHNFLVQQAARPYFKWAAHDDVLAPRFLEVCVAALDRDAAIVLASPASQYIDEKGEVLEFLPERGGVLDRAGVCWPDLPEHNEGLMSADAAARFEAVLRWMVMCVEIFGVMRTSALKQTALQGPFGGADKVVLAQMSLLGPFWLGQETLFYRRSHPQQFSASLNGRYRAQWFSGRREPTFVQQLKLLRAYCASVSNGGLTPRQRYTCLRAILLRAAERGHQWQRLTGALVGTS